MHVFPRSSIRRCYSIFLNQCGREICCWVRQCPFTQSSSGKFWHSIHVTTRATVRKIHFWLRTHFDTFKALAFSLHLLSFVWKPATLHFVQGPAKNGRSKAFSVCAKIRRSPKYRPCASGSSRAFVATIALSVNVLATSPLLLDELHKSFRGSSHVRAIVCIGPFGYA